jgi:NitT/TauT family transport system ATP-binding protein
VIPSAKPDRRFHPVVHSRHDVEEALVLAQRIYVLSSHPGRVRCELVVPFGPERDHGIRRDMRFLDLRDEIQEMLLVEATDV